MSPQAELDFFALMADQVAVRTRFLDQTLLRLTRAGCAQVVLLARGMDTRAFRLDWPTALRSAGFDPTQTTAWLAEGIVALWQGGPADLTGWLTDHGWQPSIRDLREVAAGYHRTVPTELTGGATDASRA